MGKRIFAADVWTRVWGVEEDFLADVRTEWDCVTCQA